MTESGSVVARTAGFLATREVCLRVLKNILS
jgi:hypothetical protein